MLSIFSVKNFSCPHAGAHAVLYDLLFFYDRILPIKSSNFIEFF